MFLALLNTSIVTSDESYTVRTVPTASYVGHESTAQLMAHLLGIDVPVSRDLFTQEVGQVALALKLNDRPPPGKELTIEEMEEVGYTFKLITRTR